MCLSSLSYKCPVQSSSFRLEDAGMGPGHGVTALSTALQQSRNFSPSNLVE